MGWTAHEATETELGKLRSDGQGCRLWMVIHYPAVVLACQVNQTFNSRDKVYQVTYNNVTSGSYSNVLAGMTVWVGSTAGGYDLGMCRVRKAPTSSVLYIGLTSEIAWADDVYLTVVDSMALWAKHPGKSGGALTMDYDIAYDDQHENFGPVPVMGPDAVLVLEESTVSLSPSAANSWVLGGSISAYSWSAPGASASSGMSTATPTITYNAKGVYRDSCTVTGNGKTTPGYRNVFVLDGPLSGDSGGTGTAGTAVVVDDFELEDLSGDYDRGGWTATVKLYDDAGIAAVMPMAKVVLFGVDSYGQVTESVGPIGGYENVILCGWIDGESIQQDLNGGTVTFTIEGAGNWLDKENGFAVTLSDDSSPTAWTQIEDMTVDRALWHILYWRSTACNVIDVQLSGDSKLVPNLDAASGPVWRQLEELAGKILAAPCCDRYGRLSIEIHPQYLLPASRDALAVVMDLEDGDWDADEGIQIERVKHGAGGMIEITASWYDGVDEVAVMARAPGNVFSRYGDMDTIDGLVVSSQANANQVAGLLLAKANLEYPSVTIPLAMNNRLIDISPRQYITLSVAAGDTPRGITWSEKRLIPNRIEFAYDAESGRFHPTVECEAESDYGGAGVTIKIPTQPTPNIPPQPGIDDPDIGDIDYPDFPISPISPFLPNPQPDYDVPDPDPTPDEEGDACKTNLSAPENGPWTLGLGGLTVMSNSHFATRSLFQCYVRDGDAVYPTKYRIIARFQKYNGTTYEWEDTEDDFFYNLYAVNSSGTRIATGKHDAVENANERSGYFDPEVALAAYAFELEAAQNEFYPSTISFAIDLQGATLVDEGEHGWEYRKYGAYIYWNNLQLTGRDVTPRIYTYFDQSYKNNTFYFQAHAIGETEGFGAGKGTEFRDITFLAWKIVNGNLAGGGQIGIASETFSPTVGEFSVLYGPSSYVHGDINEILGFVTQIKRASSPYVFDPQFPFEVSVWWYVGLAAEYRIQIDSVMLYNICGKDWA